MRIPIARDGYRFAWMPLAVAVVCAFLQLWVPAAVALGATAFILFFFRDFERATPRIEGAIFAAGDGVVDDIEEVEAPDFPGGRALKVGVFLSLFNCHITRSPVGGRVERMRHQPGQFLNAMRRDAGTSNQHNHIVISANGMRVVARQISGAVARRVICTAHIGESLRAGQRLGLIRFGSRVEVYMPVGAELRVRKGSRVRAGQSVLAILRD